MFSGQLKYHCGRHRKIWKYIESGLYYCRFRPEMFKFNVRNEVLSFQIRNLWECQYIEAERPVRREECCLSWQVLIAPPSSSYLCGTSPAQSVSSLSPPPPHHQHCGLIIILLLTMSRYRSQCCFPSLTRYKL